MANLSFIDKQLIEDIFEMNGGCFLKFSNKTFQEFFGDIVQYDIYEKYPGLSKAKMFREFIKNETDTYVGKAIVLLINYMNSNYLVKPEKKGQTKPII